MREFRDWRFDRGRCQVVRTVRRQGLNRLVTGLVRVLDAVVLAPAAEMGDGQHHDGFRRRITRQPIGHDGARHNPDCVRS
jgi:hypothetical protein